MGDAPTPPTVPDPTQTAAAQYGANVQSGVANSILSNPNVTNPYGSVTYTQSGNTTNVGGYDIPQFNENVQLSPAQQTLLDQQTGLGQQENTIAGTALTNVGSVLGSPVTQAPNLQTAVPGTPELSTSAFDFGNPGTIQTGLGSQGPIASSINSGGQVQGSIAGAGPVTNGFFAGAPVGTSYNNGGAVASSFNAGAPVTTSYGSGGQIASGFNGGQPVQSQIGPTNFTSDVNATTGAIQARLAPQLQLEQQQLTAQLANQGVTPGSQAYETAMDQFGRQENDANTQALLAGDQEQQTLFGESQAQGQFANQATAQQYAQNQGQAAFANTAQQQANTQNAAAAAFANQGQQQQFSENQAGAGFFNAAQQQTNSQNAAAAAFANQGAAQQYAQNQGQATFANTAQQQQFGQNQAQGTFANTAQQQNFSQNAAQTAAQNAAQQQAFGQAQAEGNFTDAAQQQQFGQNLQGSQQYNAALAQQFNQSQAQASFSNNAQLQQLQAQQQLGQLPINEVSALMSGGQVTAPQFAAYQPGSIAAAPVAQSAYNSAGLLNQQYTTQLQAQGAQNAGLFGLGGSVAGAVGNYLTSPSDRRLKRDIVETGKIGRFRAYAFRYLWSDQMHIGVMADEVLPVMPHAVAVNDNGFMSVDYSKLAA